MENLIRPQRYGLRQRRKKLSISLTVEQVSAVQKVMRQHNLLQAGAISRIIDEWREVKQHTGQGEA